MGPSRKAFRSKSRKIDSFPLRTPLILKCPKFFAPKRTGVRLFASEETPPLSEKCHHWKTPLIADVFYGQPLKQSYCTPILSIFMRLEMVVMQANIVPCNNNYWTFNTNSPEVYLKVPYVDCKLYGVKPNFVV